MGGTAGQHAARRAALDPRACRGGSPVQLGRPVARPGLGPAVQHVRRAGSRLRSLHTRTARRRWPRPAESRGDRHASACIPRRAADGRRRGGTRPGGELESLPVRRADGHGPDPLGRRTTGDRSGPCRDHRSIPHEARSELARRYLHVFGPTTPAAFATWAGIGLAEAAAAFDALKRSLTAVRTPIGEAWILARDEPAFRAPAGPAAAARLLPSGDAYYLLQGADRELLVPDAELRGRLWTSRVWPGAVLVAGEIAGTWRRAQANLTITPWLRLAREKREAVEAEAQTLPLPGVEGRIAVRWED